MAKVSAHGNILLTYLSPKRRGLIRYMSDGTVLRRTPFEGWKIFGHAKNRLDLTDYLAFVETLRAKVAGYPAWTRVTSIPSFDALRRMEQDGICETPSGHRVEPDGRGPDGSPSWLLVFGLI